MDFMSDYLAYTGQTEPPTTYHRWCAVSVVGALLARSCYINFGHNRIFPNLYTMLIGEPGTRKSTAIKIGKKLVSASGYEYIGADKTTKEKFLLDLEGVTGEDDWKLSSPSLRNRLGKKEEGNGGNDYSSSETARNLWDESDLLAISEPKEVFVMADEFNEFTSPGNHEFYTTLGNLWDWDDPKTPFQQRLKNSRSVSIFQPTISILGGNTQENFAKAFPPEIIGNGFLSRLLLIYGERSKRKYAFPPTPSLEETDEILKQLGVIRNLRRQEVIVTPGALRLCEDIYMNWEPIDDSRFGSYDQRRYIQMLKLSLICSAARNEIEISAEIIVEANTILAAAEVNMPRALGEFGKNKNSDVVNRVLGIIETAIKPLQANEIWANVMKDLDKPEQLNTILTNLQAAKKIQMIKGAGWLPRKEVRKEMGYVDFGAYLSEEERESL